MKKLIAFINVLPNGFCDQTAVIADDELHQNASALLRTADTGFRRCNALL
jgi:dihydrofolate reductase